MQLFDAPRSLADAVANFLIEGRALGKQLLVIVRPSNWVLIETYLERRGFPVHDSRERPIVLDARKVRRQICRRGVLDAERMRDTLERTIAPLASRPDGLWIYGEVVELFAEEGNFRDAEALESAWNDLQKKYAFTLLCGYSSAHFADPNISHHLSETIRLHTHARSQPADSLGSWLTHR